MKTTIALFIALIISTSLHAGTVIIRYGDDIVIDYEMASWIYRGQRRYFGYDDAAWANITYFTSNSRWERYYYQIPIHIMFTEAPADCVVFKVYKTDRWVHEYQDITLTINQLVAPLDPSIEHRYGNFKAPGHDPVAADTSLTLKSDYDGWIHFNITKLFNDWALKKTDNFGLVVKMLIEDRPVQQRIVIAQSSNPDSTKWPIFEVYAPFLPDTVLTSASITTGVFRDSSQPTNFSLSSFPNPFNASTTIHYEIPRADAANIYIYNLRGQMIKHFDLGTQAAGAYSIRWDGTNTNAVQVASGTYICIIKTPTSRKSIKMLLLR